MKTGWKGYSAGALAAACYGLNPLFALPLYARGMDVDSVLFYRYFFAVVMMGVLLKVEGQTFHLHRREILPLLGLGLLFSCSSLFLFLSYNYMDAGIASTLLFIYPILTALIMALVYKEKVSRKTVLSISLAFVGILLLTRTSGGGMVSLLGIALVFLSSLTYALYIVAVNRSFLKDFPSAKITFYALLSGILIYVVRLQGCTTLQIPSDLFMWGCCFGLAFFPTIISLVFMNISIHHIGSTRASILGALEPVTALIVGVLVFHEAFTFRIFCGIVLVLGGVTLMVYHKKSK